MDWQANIEAGRYKEALAQLRALELVEKGQPEVRASLARIVDFAEQVRAKNFMAAKKNLPIQMPSFVQTNFLEPAAALKELEDGGPFTESLNHPLTRSEAENQIGVALALGEDTTLARAHFINAIAHDPEHYRAIVNLGNLDLQSGNIDAAIAQYQKAILLNANYPTAHNNLAAAYKRSGKLSQAVNSLKRANRLEMNQAKNMGNPNDQTNNNSWGNNNWLQSRYAIIVLMVVLVVFAALLRR